MTGETFSVLLYGLCAGGLVAAGIAAAKGYGAHALLAGFALGAAILVAGWLDEFDPTVVMFFILGLATLVGAAAGLVLGFLVRVVRHRGRA